MTAASFTWMDHAPGDTERVREALRAFDDQGTLDPLGFGVVRDAFSNMLFPGITTNQTRAKYFLLVPWTYRRVHRERLSPRRALERARELEVRTIFALVNGSAGATGIIGRRVGAAIGALPSDAYWSGLSNWAIRTFEGSQRDYLTAALSDDGFPGLPESPPGIYESTNIRLTSEEADFLEQRVLTTHPESFLARCLLGRKDPNSGQMPWDHAEATNLSPPLTRQLHHAELFSVATWGAGLALNRTVADLRAADRGALGTPVLEWNIAAWLETVRLNQSSLRAWDRDDLWHLVEEKTFVPHHTRRFVNQWLDLVLTQPVAVVDPSPQVLNMLRAREHQLKGPRARLVSQRARETNTGLQGTDPLNYRWGNAARIITDIRRGLR